MNIFLHKESERGRGDYGWLTTRYSFSFADWYDERRMGFGALRVLNDDSIAPSFGFGKHGHRNMEIITIVTRGEVTHEDSMGNRYVVKAGDVQVMSAGTGVLHSEANNSPIETLELFQLWIEPKEYEIAPRYEQRSFDFISIKNSLIPLVNKNGLHINQDASIVYGSLQGKHSLEYSLESKERGVYLFVIDGDMVVEGSHITRRDALCITETETVTLYSESGAQFLVIEVPLR